MCQLLLFHFINSQKYDKQQLLIVTDGGAIPAQGSISFVLGDEKGNCFLRYWGQLAGINTKYFRA